MDIDEGGRVHGNDPIEPESEEGGPSVQVCHTPSHCILPCLTDITTKPISTSTGALTSVGITRPISMSTSTSSSVQEVASPSAFASHAPGPSPSPLSSHSSGPTPRPVREIMTRDEINRIANARYPQKSVVMPTVRPGEPHHASIIHTFYDSTHAGPDRQLDEDVDHACYARVERSPTWAAWVTRWLD